MKANTKLILSVALFINLYSYGQVLQMNFNSNDGRHSAGSIILSLSDSSSLIAGYNYDLSATTITNPNTLLFKINKMGAILWQKEIKGVGASKRTMPVSLKLAANGDILFIANSHEATYTNHTSLVYRFSNNGTLKWKKALRFTDFNGNPLHTAGEYVSDFTELPDGRIVLVGTKNASPSIAESMILVLKNTLSTTTPTVQYADVMNAPSSDGFTNIVSDGFSCYISGQYYDGSGSPNSDIVVLKYNPGSSATDTIGNKIWTKIYNYTALNPVNNAAVNNANSPVKMMQRGDKLLINSTSASDWWSNTSKSTELVTIDTNGNNIAIHQFAYKKSHANSGSIIPIGSNSFINTQSPANSLFDNSTLAIGNGDLIPNTVITRTDLTNGKVSREINLDGNQSIYDIYNQANKLDMIGCNNNDTFKEIYLLKTFINFEEMNQNGCELLPDSLRLINLNANLVNKSYSKIDQPFYFDYSYDPIISIPNLESKYLCGSLCNFGVSISKSGNGIYDTLHANTIGTVTNATYLWNTGATTKNIVVSASGKYSVTVTDSSGCSSIANIKVQSVFTPCKAYKNFTWTKTGNTYYFSVNPSIPSIYSPTYLWIFSNGQTSTSANPTNNITIPGTHIVRLIYCLKDSTNRIICCDSVNKTITIQGSVGCGSPCNVSANFTYTLKSNGEVSFSDKSTPKNQMYTYYWSFGDGTYSTQKNPSKSYTSNGTKTVCLIVRKWLNGNSIYCEDTICKTITITNVNPCNRFLPNFTWSFQNGSYQISNTSNMTGLTFISASFTVSNGNSYNYNNPLIGFKKEGQYAITMTMVVYDPTTGTTCTKTITKYINVINTICGCLDAKNYYYTIGKKIYFTDASSCTDSTTDYLYKFGNGDTAMSPSPSYTFASPGLYRTVMFIERIIGNDTCKDSFVRIIQIVLGDSCKDTGVVNSYNYPCPTYISPVCGCDSITYKNYCLAEMAGVKQYSSGPCPWDTNYVLLCGFVYNDMNKDCNIDTSDLVIPNMRIDFNSTPTKSVFTGYQGYYKSYFNKGNYTITQNLTSSSSPFPFFQICPTGSISVSALSPGIYCNRNFFDTSNSCQNLKIKIAKIRNLTPGFVSKKRITYFNKGATPIANVKIHYRFLAPLSVRYSTSPTYTVSGNIITWTVGTVAPYSSGFLNVDFETPTTLALGTTVIDSVWIEPISGDCAPSDNSDTYTDVCVGSYDPNDKQVAQDALLDTSIITLDYHIRFQNTGTAPAHNVLVTDILDQNLDLNSLKVHGSSHSMEYFLEDDKKLSFEFVNIMLPDSGTDYDASQGFISYSINRKKNLAIGTDIKNTAAIYFDFNDPVITNTTINTIYLKSSSGVTTMIDDNQISLYPNPIQNSAMLKIELARPGDLSYSIFDIQGKLIKSRNLNTKSTLLSDEINLEHLPKGIYILNLTINQQDSSIKIVKE